jgi:hypothetical protein
VGIEQVQGVHEKNSISNSEIREVSKENTYRVSIILCMKTCVRSAPGQHLDEVLKDNYLKVSQSTRSVQRRELFQVQKLKRDSVS